MLKHQIEVHENDNGIIDRISVKLPQRGQEFNILGETAHDVYWQLLRLVRSLGLQGVPAPAASHVPAAGMQQAIVNGHTPETAVDAWGGGTAFDWD
jgi:hypothetical protein